MTQSLIVSGHAAIPLKGKPMALTTKDALKKLIKLFGPNGEKWCKKAAAINKNGTHVNPMSRKAVGFCLDGGARRVAGLDDALYYHLREVIHHQLDGRSITGFNDTRRSFAAVKKVLEKALAAE
jgi:hypothetical protein